MFRLSLVKLTSSNKIKLQVYTDQLCILLFSITEYVSRE